jgi:hypothetical protein
MSSLDRHQFYCACWDCEDERKEKGMESIFDLERRQQEERFRENNPVRCICPDDAAYHTLACRQQDWSKNKGI